MSTPELKDREQLTNEYIRRFLTYSDTITWFGSNSVMRAVAVATATLVAGAYQLYVSVIRRFTLIASSDAFLVDVAGERGVSQLPAIRSKLFVVVVPHTTTVDDIRDVSGDDHIEVADSTNFPATSSIRVRSADGSTTEVAVVASVSAGTGLVNGNDELVITGGLANVYAPTTENVEVLRRHTLPAGTRLNTLIGVGFDTIEPVSVGDSNPIMAGESTALGLADKARAEAVIPSETGNIEALAVSGFESAVAEVAGVFNPEPGTGGADLESDYDLKFRTAHFPTLQSMETEAFFLAMGKRANPDLLRLVRTTDTELRKLSFLALKRNGGAFTADELSDMTTYIDARQRSQTGVTLTNMALTAVEVEASITLEPDAVLSDVWREATNRLVEFLDFRKWDFGEDVDEASLLTIVKQTPGVATLVTATFLPASDVLVGDQSLPTLARLSLLDTTTGGTLNATLSVSF